MEGVQCKRVFGSDNRWGGEEGGGHCTRRCC